jgi:hypothetical protein
MRMIVRLYSDLSLDEKTAINVIGIPDGWPAEVSYAEEVPSGWIEMNEVQLASQKVTYQSAYDAWVASRIPTPPTPEDDTSTIQGNISNGNYGKIMSRSSRNGFYAVFFNANANVTSIKYRIYIDEDPVEDSERSITFLEPTDTILTTHADIVLNNQSISVRYTSLDGSGVTITKRSLVLVQKDGE